MRAADLDARNMALAAWAEEYVRGLRMRPSDAAEHMRRHPDATLRALRVVMPDADAVDVAAATVHAADGDGC